MTAQVAIRSRELRVAVDLQGGVISELGRPGGPNLLARRDWAAPVPASRSETYGSDELDFLSNYQAGWHELFPNAGTPCRVLDTPLPFHGDVARATWDVALAKSHRVTLTCPTRLPITLTRRMTVDGTHLLIEEEARNESPLTVPFLWGHHPVFPARRGMRIDLPACVVTVDPEWCPRHADLVRGASARWPVVPGTDGPMDLSRLPVGPAERLVFATDLDQTWAALRDPEAGWGVAYCWDPNTFPYAWHWLQMGGEDFPWFGRAAYVAVEPQSVPHARGLAEAISRGENPTLPPHGTHHTWLTLSLVPDASRAVTGVDRAGPVLQG